MTMTKLHSDAQPSLGHWLRNARLEQGLDTTLAARRTRTRVAVIEALEADNYQALGAPVFIRMYLLRYGELLGLEEHEILGRFKALGIDEPPPLRVAHPMNSQPRTSDLRWLSYPAAFALIGWLGWTVTQQLPDINDDSHLLPAGFELTGINPDQLNVEPTPVPPVVTVAESPDSAANVAPNNETIHLALATDVPPPLLTPLPPPTLRNSTNLQALGSALASEIQTPPEPEPEQPLPNHHELVVEAIDECWVEVEDGEGRRLVYALLTANERRTVNGPAPFSIRLGNAPAVTILFNGETVDRAVYVPSRGSVNRFTLQAP